VDTSNYNGSRTKLKQQFDNGLTYLPRLHLVEEDHVGCRRQLNGGSVALIAPDVPGLGPKFDGVWPT